MRRRAIILLLALAATQMGGRACWAIVNGSSLALKSGVNSGTAELLGNDGYAGTYINVTTPGDVTITVNASGSVTSPSDTVHMNMVLADTKAGFDFIPTVAGDYSHTFQNVPVGTYFIRSEYTNDNGNASRSLKINTLDVTPPATNAATFTVNNATDSTSLKANALAAADTYIQNFRRGTAALTISNVTPGSQVHVKLARHAFNFGVNVPGSSASTLDTYLGTPTPGSNAESFQQFIASHYINTLVPSNYGKWSNTEGTQNVPTMGNVDTLLNFAQTHNMRARMHALAWGDQNPTWVLNAPTAGQYGTGLLASAMPGNGGNTAPYVAALSNRIDYYVGTGSASDRDKKYIELDVHNEELHKIGTWTALGAAGEANLFKEVKDTVAASGANTRLYVNEYNVLQNSASSIRAPLAGETSSFPYNGVQVGTDVYANWYRQNIDDIQNAAVSMGYGPVISGVGSQYYITANGPAHSPDTMMKALQNLAVTGLPMSLTEFGVDGTVIASDNPTTRATAATDMEEAMRMVFGNPDAQTFMYWGFWAGATSSLQSGGTLVGTSNPDGTQKTPADNAWKNPDGSWNLTPAGKRYEWLFGISPDPTKGGTNASPWTTDVTLTADANGQVDLTGFYGDYTVSVGNKSTSMSLIKGGPTSLAVALNIGDYNNDGIVDAADYTVWRDTLGSTTDLRADGNGDGTVNQDDYTSWTSNFGKVYSSGSGAAVPEPASVALLVMGSLALAFCRRSPRALRAA